MKQRVALYARVSSERQAEEQTIESQLEALRHHVKEQGLGVDFIVFVQSVFFSSSDTAPMTSVV